jgi:hypothetical protein
VYHWLKSQELVHQWHPKLGEVFMKKAQTKTEKKDNKAVVELSEKELAVVAGGRRIIVYQ